MKGLLITGSAGKIGSTLREGLRGRFDPIRLLDRAPQPPAREGEEVLDADITDLAALEPALSGMDACVHLAGIPTEASASELFRTNFVGTHTVFEAARRQGVRRLVFASTNHVTGFYETGRTVGPTDPIRPDTLYGVSKAYGEALGRLYHDKYGLEVACLRIGSFLDRPTEERHLATWLSRRDCVSLVWRCLQAEIGYVIVYGVSANTRSFWRDEAARQVGYEPEDNAADFSASVAPEPDPGRPEARHQGGDYVNPSYEPGAFDRSTDERSNSNV